VARVARQTTTREYKDLDAHFTANLGYSHHQKAIILDGPPEKEDLDVRRERGSEPLCNGNGAASGPRRIMAYVGGIDLTGEFPYKRLNEGGVLSFFECSSLIICLLLPVNHISQGRGNFFDLPFSSSNDEGNFFYDFGRPWMQ